MSDRYFIVETHIGGGQYSKKTRRDTPRLIYDRLTKRYVGHGAVVRIYPSQQAASAWIRRNQA
jgi:hypothetical protein